MKRAFDLIVSLIGIGLCAPLLAVAVILIKLDSPGPALFRQQRVGRGGRPFTLLKLRTMVSAGARPGAGITVAGDPRITKVGAFLRRFKLDELPQLLNIARGEMSFVGPRPELPRYVALYAPDDAAVVLSVSPGLTDPASLALFDEAELLRGAEDPEQFYVEQLLPYKVSVYRRYVASQSFGGDCALIGQTVLRVFGRRARLDAPPPPGIAPLPSNSASL